MRESADRRSIQVARSDQSALQLDKPNARAGVVAFSSGNHAQGVAIAARRLGIPAVIVMPADAPTLKIEGTRAQGAEIIFYDRMTESREEISARISAETGAIVVPSFDDPAIVAGQGTAAWKFSAQLQEAGAQSTSRDRDPGWWRWSCRRDSAGLPTVRDRRRRALRLGRYGKVARRRFDCAGRAQPAPNTLRRPANAARFADHIWYFRGRAAQITSVDDVRLPRQSDGRTNTMDWWSSRAGRSRLLRCLRVRPTCRTAASSSCQEEISTPIYTSGWLNRIRRQQSDIRPDRHARGLDRSTARVSSSSSAASVCNSAASALGSVSAMLADASSKRVEHHRNARQDRHLDPFKCLIKALFSLVAGHGRVMSDKGLSLRERGATCRPSPTPR